MNYQITIRDIRADKFVQTSREKEKGKPNLGAEREEERKTKRNYIKKPRHASNQTLS